MRLGLGLTLILATTLVSTASAAKLWEGEDVQMLVDTDTQSNPSSANPSPPPVQYWNPPSIEEGDVADNGTVNGTYNYSEVSAKIRMQDEFAFNNDTLDEIWSKTTAVRFGHPKLITPQIYNFTSGVIGPCGNGVRDFGEQCDDGNTKSGDGCTGNCTVEGGWACESKSERQDAGKCKLCGADECTVFYNNAWHCLNTKLKTSDGKKQESVYQRAANGFCECHESRCQLDDICIKPEEAQNRSSGWYRVSNGTCGCATGFCLMPTAQGTDANPEKNACIRMGENYKIDPATGMCACADAEPAVSSTDPSIANPGKNAACKSYPSKPLPKLKSLSKNPLDVYAAFQCNTNPYSTSRSDLLCDACEAGSCKLPREMRSNNGASPAAQPGMFSCFNSEAQAEFGFTTGSDGTCVCDGSDSCLVPHRDGFKCKKLDAAHPYGGAITSEGRCGCANDVTSCIMGTSKLPNGTVNDFLCLDLGTSLNKTEYGEKFVRGPGGYCQCADKHCTSDRRTESLGDFDCIDTAKDSNYVKDSSNGKCKCVSPCQFTHGPSSQGEQCSTCPTEPGTCVARCSTNESNSNVSSTVCTKYCTTKTVKFATPPGKSPAEFVGKKDMIARAIDCFITKTVNCTKDENNTPNKGWLCEQRVSARMLYNCPARWSQHANRVLPDGTETHGFQSVCDANDLECQLQSCDRDTAHSGMCVDKLATA